MAAPSHLPGVGKRLHNGRWNHPPTRTLNAQYQRDGRRIWWDHVLRLWGMQRVPRPREQPEDCDYTETFATAIAYLCHDHPRLDRILRADKLDQYGHLRQWRTITPKMQLHIVQLRRAG